MYDFVCVPLVPVHVLVRVCVPAPHELEHVPHEPPTHVGVAEHELHEAAAVHVPVPPVAAHERDTSAGLAVQHCPLPPVHEYDAVSVPELQAVAVPPVAAQLCDLEGSLAGLQEAEHDCDVEGLAP